MANYLPESNQFRGRGRSYMMFYADWLQAIAGAAGREYTIQIEKQHPAPHIVEQINRISPARAVTLLAGLLRAGRNRDCLQVADREMAQLTGLTLNTIKYGARPDLIELEIVRFASGRKQSGNIENYYQLIPPPATLPPSSKSDQGAWSKFDQGLVKKSPADRQNLTKGSSKSDQANKDSRTNVAGSDSVSPGLEIYQKFGLRGHRIAERLSSYGINAQTIGELVGGLVEMGISDDDLNRAYLLAVQKVESGAAGGEHLDRRRWSGHFRQAAAGYCVGILRRSLEAEKLILPTMAEIMRPD